MMGKSWGNDGEIMGKSWGNDGEMPQAFGLQTPLPFQQDWIETRSKSAKIRTS